MRRMLAAGGVMVLMAASSPGIAGEVAPEDVVFQDFAVEDSLTGVPGNPEDGAKYVASRSLGNCITCHAVSALAHEPFHGNVAPSLDGVADRWTTAELRAIVIDAKQIFSEESMMPGFYTLKLGQRVRKALVGKTILTAQQVEDVVAYLETLKE